MDNARKEADMNSPFSKDVTAAQLNVLLQGERPVLADFYATWCAPCRAMGPIVERVAERFAGRAEIVKVNIDSHGDLAEKLGVRGVPTLMLFVKGRAVDRIVGMSNENTIAALLDTHI